MALQQSDHPPFRFGLSHALSHSSRLLILSALQCPVPKGSNLSNSSAHATWIKYPPTACLRMRHCLSSRSGNGGI